MAAFDQSAKNKTQTLQEGYFYDTLGNRLMGQDVGQAAAGYQYQGSKLVAVKRSSGLTQVTYNAMGQPLSYPTVQGLMRFSYINGQVAKAWLNNQLLAEYAYNDAGQRIKKVVYQQGAKVLATPTTQYYYYNGSQLAGELNAQGNISRQYIYTGQRLLATVDYAVAVAPISQAVGLRSKLAALWGKGQQGQWHFVVNDYMGRPRMVTNASQEVIWQDKGRALFGESDVQQGHYVLNIRFAGQYADAETGFYYNGYRYYDPATGRYTTPDPLGLRGGENQYGYVNQQPNQYFDPQGLLLFAFDGTGNTDDLKINPSQTNAVKLRDIYADKGPIDTTAKLWENQDKKFASNEGKNNTNMFYISGAGTEDPYTGIGAQNAIGINSNINDNANGASLPARADQMLIYFSQYLDDLIAKQKKAGANVKEELIDIDITGFSRGATSARMFASKLEHLLTVQKYTNATNTKDPNQGDVILDPEYLNTSSKYAWGRHSLTSLQCSKVFINFRFMGIWDTVTALGTNASALGIFGENYANSNDDMAESKELGMSIAISNRFKYVAHGVAMNEHRESFVARSIYSSQSTAEVFDGKKVGSLTRIERGFMGAHADVGGGYATGDISDVSLMWMVDQAKKAGVSIDDALINSRGYNVVSNPVIHDSAANTVIGFDKGSVGPTFALGREFLWANDNASQPLQQLTGMTKDEIAKYLGADINSVAVNSAYNSQQTHLGLDWNDTLKFQNANYEAKNTLGKFENALDLTLKAMADEDCSKSALIACDANKDYQDLKTEEISPAGKKTNTLLYDPRDKDQAIQTQKYLDWIKTNYGTSLTFKPNEGVKNGTGKD